MVKRLDGSLTIEEIAKFMGKSLPFVRGAIENGSLPIGSYTSNGGKSSYYISPKRAYEWMGYERDEESNNDSIDDVAISNTERSKSR